MHNSDQADNDINAIGNGVEQYTMGVVVSAKVFSMNVDGIYQDKYGSTVRELSTNALDIHKQCGIVDKPFDIHLPSHLSGKFIIRDYGCGLSKEDVINFFANLFATSKDKDNDSVGFYGIGCKSPFTVADDFLVISRHNGIKTTYAFSRENKGTPRCIVLSSIQCDEPSGIEIVIDAGETETWAKAIREQLIMFPTRPNVYVDGELYDVGYPSITKIGDVYVGDSNDRRMPHNLYICQGGVIYPIDRKQFPTVPFKTQRTYGGFIIYTCDIGLITMPPDRERIEITDSNRDNLIEIVNKANESVGEAIVNYYHSNYDGTYKSYKKIDNDLSAMLDVDKYINTIHTNECFNETFKSITNQEYFIDAYRSHISRFCNDYVNGSPSLYVRDDGRYTKKKYTHPTVLSMIESKIPIFVIEGQTRIYELYMEYKKEHPNIFIIRAKKNKGTEIVEFLKGFSDYVGANADINLVKKVVDKTKKSTINVIPSSTYKLSDNLHKHFMKIVMVGSGTYTTYVDHEMTEEEMTKGDYYLISLSNNNNEFYCYKRYICMDDLYYLSNNLDKPIYFMRNKYFRLMKHGIKIEPHDVFDSIVKKDPNYLEIAMKRNSWNRSFYTSNRKKLYEQFQTKHGFEKACDIVGIDLKQSQFNMRMILDKFDIFKNTNCNSTVNTILSDINVNRHEFRKIVTNIFKG